MSYQSLDNKKRLVKSRSGLRIVSLDEERTSPFELKEPFWVPDNESPSCGKCHTRFDLLTRRHHCRRCGNVYCKNCCDNKVLLPRMCFVDPVRVCGQCLDASKKESDFYERHLKVLLSGAHFNLDDVTGSGSVFPVICLLSKDHQAIMFDGSNLWQHNPVNLVDIVSIRVLGSSRGSGTQMVGGVIKFLDFKKDEKELRMMLPEVPNQKQSTAWIHALQKALKYVSPDS